MEERTEMGNPDYCTFAIWNECTFAVWDEGSKQAAKLQVSGADAKNR